MWHLTLTKHEPATAHAVAELKSMMENLMSQVDDLAGILTSVQSDVANVLDQVRSLEDQLTQLQQTTPPQVDLSSVIAQATNIRNSLEGVATAGDGSAQPDPTPAAPNDTPNSELSSSTDTSTGSADAGGSTASDDMPAEPIPDAQP
jgi:prophage DNA circulation protein